MKRLVLLVVLVLIAATGWGQKRTMITDKSVVREELLLNGDTLSGVDRDTLLQSPSSKKVPSTEAVSKYVNEKAVKYDNTNSGLSAITRVQAIDRLAKLQTFDDVKQMRSLLNPNIPNGARMKIASSGLEYTIKSDSVRNYPVDNDMVISFAGKYAIADLSDRKKFRDAFEFKRLSPLLDLNIAEDYVQIGGNIVQLSYSPLELSKESSTIDTIDGFFLDTINVNFDGGNWFANSNFPSISGSASALVKRTSNYNDGISTRKATMITLGDSGGNVLGLTSGKTWSTGDTATFSYYLKPINFQNQIAIEAEFWQDGGYTPTPVTIDTSDTGYVRYSHIIPAVEGGESRVRLVFNNIGVGDSMLIDGFQLEEGTILTDLKETFGSLQEDETFIYVNYGYSSIKDGVLNASYFVESLKSGSGLVTGGVDHTEIIQKLTDYCSGGGIGINRCNVVQLDKGGYRITDTYIGRDGVVLNGSSTTFPYANTPRYSVGTAIYVAIPDSTKFAFSFDNIYANSITNSGMSNVNIMIVDTTDIVIEANNNFSCTYENLSIDIETLTSGFYGNYNIGIKSGGESADHLYTNWENIEVKEPDSIGIEEGKGNTNNWRDLHVTRSKHTGVRVGNGIDLVNATIEGSGRYAIHHLGGTSYIRELYTEGQGKVESGGDSTSAIIEVDGGGLFLVRLTNSYANNGAVARVNGGYLMLDNFPVLNGGTGDGWFYIKDTSAVEFLRILSGTAGGGTMWRVKGDVSKFMCDNCDGRSYNGVDGFKSYSFESQHFGPIIENAGIQDTLRMGRVILSGDDNQNIIVNSSSLFVSDTVTTLGAIIKNGQTVGGKTAVVIDYTQLATSSVSSFGYVNNIPIDQNIDEGDEYIVSYSIYAFSDMVPHKLFGIRMGGDNFETDEVSPIPIPKNKWVRLHQKLTRDSAVAVGNKFNLRIFGPRSDVDSIAVRNLQITKGSRPGAEVVTTGSAIYSQTPTLVGELNIEGELRPNILLDSDGDAGEPGQLFASTGTGTNWGNADAGNVDISDISGGYASTSVEGALQELTMQTEIAPSDASTIAVTKYRCIISIDNSEGSTQTQTISTANIPDGAEVFIKSNASVSVTFSLSSGNFVPLGSTTGQSTIAISGTGELKLLWSSDLNVFYQLL